MKLVEPSTRTTLLLDRNYEALGTFCTARAAIRHLITGRFRGLDATGAPYSWEGVTLDTSFSSEADPVCWKAGNIQLYPDQPYIRSAPNPITGEETRWFVPTICVCTYHFGVHGRKGESMSLNTVYKIYKGVCQYCLEHIPMNQATKDHVYPRSKGGSNDSFNIVLACRKCNSEKDCQYPYYNIDGKEVKPIKLPRYIIDDNIPIREEWKQPLYLV